MKGSVEFRDFANIVAETFDQPAASISFDTRCDDIQGWDSLGHSVLLSRLGKHLHLAIMEADAGPADTVGELFGHLVRRQKAKLA